VCLLVTCCGSLSVSGTTAECVCVCVCVVQKCVVCIAV